MRCFRVRVEVDHTGRGRFVWCTTSTTLVQRYNVKLPETETVKLSERRELVLVQVLPTAVHENEVGVGDADAELLT